MARAIVPDRLDEAGRYASGRVLLIDVRDRMRPTLEALRPTDLPDEELAGELARIALRTVAERLGEAARR